MRLRDLDIAVGELPPGPHNAITDIAGVSVGQLEVVEEGLCTGITAVVPYPARVRERRLFLGRWALDGGELATGVGVTEDFGTFSTPIVLAPAPTVGRLYDALIQYGLGRDRGLTTYAGWPPLVVGVDDTWWNPPALTYRKVGERHLARALEDAHTGAVQEGNAGIGGGLCAFGVKGGVGTASRTLRAPGDETYTVGVLVAANAGAPGRLCVDRYPVSFSGAVHSSSRSFAAVLATDAPLIPRQLDRLSSRASVGLSRVGLLDAFTEAGMVLAFSTTGLVPDPVEGEAEPVQMVGEEVLHHLFMAAAEAGEEAVLNALLGAGPIEKSGRALATLPQGEWVGQVRRYQRERIR